jgi:hypothetical protein
VTISSSSIQRLLLQFDIVANARLSAFGQVGAQVFFLPKRALTPGQLEATTITSANTISVQP